jgi:hypothetical protein
LYDFRKGGYYPMIYEKLLKYISSLSDEEREQYKDLIEDALSRDKALAEDFRAARKNAERFAENMERIVEEALKLHSSISMMNEQLLEVRDKSRIVSNMTIGNGPCMN